MQSVDRREWFVEQDVGRAGRFAVRRRIVVSEGGRALRDEVQIASGPKVRGELEAEVADSFVCIENEDLARALLVK